MNFKKKNSEKHVNWNEYGIEISKDKNWKFQHVKTSVASHGQQFECPIGSHSQIDYCADSLPNRYRTMV